MRRCPRIQAPAHKLDKTATRTSVDEVGDVIHYTLVATNTGNVTLSTVTISDPELGSLDCAQPVTLARPAHRSSCTGPTR